MTRMSAALFAFALGACSSPTPVCSPTRAPPIFGPLAADGGSVLTNFGGTVQSFEVIPDGGTTWLAARLTSPTGFQVTAVRYLLIAGEHSDVPCGNHLAHRVRVFKAATETPPENPTDVIDLAGVIPTGVDTTQQEEVLTLTSPVELMPGESLFVAIERAAGDGGVNLCPATWAGCADESRNWESATREPPYRWTHLSGAPGGANTLQFEAEGYSR